MSRRVANILLVLIIAQIATALLFNDTLIEDHDINLNGIKTRRKDRSTSSDSRSAGKYTYTILQVLKQYLTRKISAHGESKLCGRIWSDRSNGSGNKIRKLLEKKLFVIVLDLDRYHDANGSKLCCSGLEDIYGCRCNYCFGPWEGNRSATDGKRIWDASAAKDGDDSESLNVVFTDSSTEDSDGLKKTKKKKKDRTPKSTEERKGWRKWHRKCTKCPEDMQMKWRNPSIKWICGAYQRARRSFKSLCMMYYRNCQDGTMFTKIADHRCPNGTREGVHPYNFHFFYDYKVVLTSEESETGDESVSESDTQSTDISDTELAKNLPKFYFDRAK